MDLKVYNGDFETDAHGMIRVVSGTQELLQRALIRLTVPRGAFALDPKLGSELYRLRHNPALQTPAQALRLAREALADFGGVAVERAEYISQGDKAYITLWLKANNTMLEAVTTL